MGGEVHNHGLEGSAEVLLCGSLGGPHTETGMLGSVGEGFEVVIISPAVKEEGSCPGPDSFWNPDDLPEFCGGGHLNQKAFYHQGWDSRWPGPSFSMSLLGDLPGWLGSGSSGLWRAGALFLLLPVDGPETLFI